MFTSYPITIYPDSPLYDSVCEGGTGNLFNSGNDDPEECIKQAIVNHCIKVTSNYKEACITWTTNQTPMYICASFPDIPDAGCTSYGDRPELQITHINGEEAMANPDDDKFYVCDDDILTIAISDFDVEKNLVYGWLYTSMDIANDYPSDYAVLNGDGTITVEVGNLLEGGNEWCQLASYDPANVGECWSEMGVTTWENADKTNTPILGAQVNISNRVYRYDILNSASYSTEVEIEVIDGTDGFTYDIFYDGEQDLNYIKLTLRTETPQGYETQFYARAKDNTKCWSDRGTAFLKATATETLTSITNLQLCHIIEANSNCFGWVQSGTWVFRPRIGFRGTVTHSGGSFALSGYQFTPPEGILTGFEASTLKSFTPSYDVIYYASYNGIYYCNWVADHGLSDALQRGYAFASNNVYPKWRNSTVIFPPNPTRAQAKNAIRDVLLAPDTHNKDNDIYCSFEYAYGTDKHKPWISVSWTGEACGGSSGCKNSPYCGHGMVVWDEGMTIYQTIEAYLDRFVDTLMPYLQPE